jgi:hypothetical protein
VTDPRNAEGLDTTAVDDGWGDDEGAVAPPRAPATPVKAEPRALRPPPKPEAGASDDDIEFEADAVARDSMPTFQHPNPLQFDQDPDAEAKLRPRIPKPPPLPKRRGR